jgi:hypothetical protein
VAYNITLVQTDKRQSFDHHPIFMPHALLRACWVLKLNLFVVKIIFLVFLDCFDVLILKLKLKKYIILIHF